VTRVEILASKLAAYFTYMLILNGVILLVGFVSLEMFKSGTEYRLSSFLVHSAYSFLLMLTFGAIGLFISLLIKRGRPTTSASIGIVMGGYFFDALSKVTPTANWLGYISPFKFIDNSVMRPDFGLEWWRVLYFVLVSLTLISVTFWIYRKKDILV
jgi:ABC-2 type transport system permease protein